MENLAAFVGIATALAIGAASPGPSFILVARTAAASRARGAQTALGMGAGGLLFAIAALAGLQSLLSAVPSLYMALKLAGGLYLVYLGLRIWRGATEPLGDGAPASRGLVARPFLLGLVTQLSNPKAAIIYSSVFAAFLPAQTSLLFDVSIAAAVACIETGWYLLVTLVLSSPVPRQAYLRHKAWVDRGAAAVMAALGFKLMLDIGGEWHAQESAGRLHH